MHARPTASSFPENHVTSFSLNLPSRPHRRLIACQSFLRVHIFIPRNDSPSIIQEAHADPATYHELINYQSCDLAAVWLPRKIIDGKIIDGMFRVEDLVRFHSYEHGLFPRSLCVLRAYCVNLFPAASRLGVGMMAPFARPNETR